MLKNADGLFIDDEAYKKAYTDALGIACKALGFGADIYWGRNDSKYDSGTATTASSSAKESDSKPETAAAPQKAETTESVKGLPELSPSHPRWDAFISWAAKKPKDKPSWQLRSAIRKQWTITDANFTELMRLAGRAS